MRYKRSFTDCATYQAYRHQIIQLGDRDKSVNNLPKAARQHRSRLELARSLSRVQLPRMNYGHLVTESYGHRVSWSPVTKQPSHLIIRVQKYSGSIVVGHLGEGVG